MTEQVPFVRVQTPLEQALEDIRKAQLNYDLAVDQAKDLSTSAAEARVRADNMYQELAEARNQLYKEAIRPLSPTNVPPYGLAVAEDNAPAEEVGWSEGAPDADKDLIQSDDAAAESEPETTERIPDGSLSEDS